MQKYEKIVLIIMIALGVYEFSPLKKYVDDALKLLNDILNF